MAVPRVLSLSVLALGAVAFVTAACRSNQGCCCAQRSVSYPPTTSTLSYPAPASPAPSTAAPPSAFEAQVARGQAAYGRYCAQCHGAGGEGTRNAPRLVGPGALPLTRPGAQVRTGEFRTAGDVARFVVANMPPKGEKPAADDYWAILAFDLKANKVARTDAVNASNADSIVLHP